MVAVDMSPEMLESGVLQKERAIKFPDNSELRAEFGEWLQPSQEVIHQTGLELVNTRLFIDQLSKERGMPITVDMISSEQWNDLLKNHDIVWFMGIYKPSEWSRHHAEEYSDEYKYALSDLDPEHDVAASPFAIPEYSPNPTIAPDWNAWDKMVEKLHGLKKKVFVDFVPNHVAVDHPWANTNPEYLVCGTLAQFEENPSLYQKVIADDGKTYFLAHGKDPNFSEWTDTLQLNYANPAVQEEMKKILFNLAEHADGARCDMAMLLDASTFIRTWGSHLSEEEKKYITEHNFWESTIPEVKDRAKTLGKDDFSFIAEAYWDKEELGQYFDYIYGKDFYDHLKRIVENKEQPGQNLKDHIRHIMTAVRNGRHYRDVLFTENHDEERAVKVFGREPSKAVAALTGLIPESIFLVNQGQEEGKQIRPPMQIARFPDETPDENMEQFYKRLLMIKRSKLFQEGDYKLTDVSLRDNKIIALQVSISPETASTELVPNHETGAIVCINMSNSTSSGEISEIGQDKNADVYRLSQGEFVANPDLKRDGGMYVELAPWETQIIFYREN